MICALSNLFQSVGVVGSRSCHLEYSGPDASRYDLMQQRYVLNLRVAAASPVCIQPCFHILNISFRKYKLLRSISSSSLRHDRDIS